MHEGGRVVTKSDLEEVLKTKTEKADRRKGGKERAYQGESYYLWECPVRYRKQSKNKLQKISA